MYCTTYLINFYQQQFPLRNQADGEPKSPGVRANSFGGKKDQPRSSTVSLRRKFSSVQVGVRFSSHVPYPRTSRSTKSPRKFRYKTLLVNRSHNLKRSEVRKVSARENQMPHLELLQLQCQQIKARKLFTLEACPSSSRMCPNSWVCYRHQNKFQKTKCFIQKMRIKPVRPSGDPSQAYKQQNSSKTSQILSHNRYTVRESTRGMPQLIEKHVRRLSAVLQVPKRRDCIHGFSHKVAKHSKGFTIIQSY